MRGTLSRIVRRVDHHWFAPASLGELGVVRIVLVGSQLLLFLPSLAGTLRLAGFPDEEFLAIPALKVLMLPFGGWGIRPTPELLTGVWIVAVVAGMLALVGLWTRASALLFAAACTLLQAHSYSYRDMHHPEALMIIALWVIAFAPAGASLSIDRLWADWRRRRAGEVPMSPMRSADARWPLRTIQWSFVLVYLSAGLSKLAGGGLDWMNGYTMSYYLLQDGMRWGIAPTLWLQEKLLLTSAMSVVAVVFELTFVVAVLFPRFTWIYVLLGIGLHTGIWVTMRAPFFQYIFLYIVFIEPLRDSIAGMMRRKTPEAEALPV